MNPRRGWRLLFCALGVMLAATPVHAQLKAGAAKVSILPKGFKNIWIAGYGQNRPAQSAHDELAARCFYVETTGGPLAVVSLDVVGFFHDDAQAARELLKKDGFDTDRVVITSTHTHSGPDTLGLWGPREGAPGRHEPYVKQLHEAVAACVRQAQKNAQPAEMGLAKTTISGVCHNVRKGDEYMQDHELRLLQFRRLKDKKPITTVVNYGCHPEVMQQKALTADFPSVLYRDLAQTTGGEVQFVNGLLGGMVTPLSKAETWEEMERIGAALEQQVTALLPSLSFVAEAPLLYSHSEVLLPVENSRFVMAAAAGVFKRKFTPQRQIPTRVSFFRLGQADFLTIPGEPLPAFGLRLKELLPGPYRFVLGLGNDELGYLMDAEVFDPDRYEESVSVGPQTGPLLYKASKKLVQQTLGGKW